MHYSPSTRGFYDTSIHGTHIPPDAIEISREDHLSLLAAEASGRVIQVGADGRPEAAAPPERPVTADDVILERERRLEQGFNYDFGDGRGIHRIGTTEADMRAWDREVTPLANALVARGDTASTIAIVTDTGEAAVTAQEWQDILIAAGEVRQPIWQASFRLAAMVPIPDDYADDRHWPAPT